MLQEVLEYIHNYFVKEATDGTFAIAAGAISPSIALKEGQRFMICGSDLNDGVYTFRAAGIRNDDDTEEAGLLDESYAGTICAMGVPPALIALSAEIKQWVENNQAALSGVFQSESFNGYSYSMKSGGGNGGNGALTWRDIYGKRLERWRKPCL